MNARILFARLIAAAALCLAAVSGTAAPLEPAAAEQTPRRERILRFDVSATVNEDASLTVREDLEFVAMGNKIKRGIIRGIPIHYRQENGRKFSVGLKVLSTSVDGRELPWQESEEGRGLFIRIGNPKQPLSPGVHRLSLIYRTTKQLGFFADHDELYWNVTGNDWDMPIQSASFRLSLPGSKPGEGFNRVAWYSGPYSSTSSDGARLDDSRTVFTTRPLQPGEGLTVAYAWPKGAVAPPPPTFGERIEDFLYARGNAIAGALMWLGMACGACFLAVGAWRARNERGGELTVVPLFHAPSRMTPSLARRLLRDAADFKSLGAELIGMAIAGLLTIHGDRSSGYRLKKTGTAAPDTLRRSLLRKLFDSHPEDELSLSNRYRQRFTGAAGLVKKDVAARTAATFLDLRAPLRRAFWCMLAGNTAAALLQLTGAVSGGSGTLCALLLALALLSLLRTRRKPTLLPRGTFGALWGAFGPTLFIICPLIVRALNGGENSLPGLSGAALTLLGLALAQRLVRWTDKGRTQFEQALGLKMFITAAAKDRLEMLNAPDDTPELFEELLPYAVAMDCAKTWGDRFEHVLAAAAWQPSWSDSPAWGAGVSRATWNDSFTGSVDRFSRGFSSSLGAASRAPRSSSGGSGFGGGGGFSGGGFSGGGGGGGGGRGW